MWKQIRKIEEQTGIPTSIEFSPDMNYLAVGTSIGILSIYQVNNSFELFTQKIVHEEDGINQVKWSSDSKLICTVSDDLTLVIMNAINLQVIHTCYGHFSYVTCCDFSNDSLRVATGSYDESIRIWDTISGDCLKTISAFSEPVSSICFSHDGDFILSSSWEGVCRIFDVFSGVCVKCYNLIKPVSFSKFLPNDLYFMAISTNNRVNLIDTLSGKIMKTYIGLKNEKYCLIGGFLVQREKQNKIEIFSPSENGSIYGWDLNTTENIWTIPDCHQGICICATAASTGNLLATCGSTNDDRTIIIWERSSETI